MFVPVWCRWCSIVRFTRCPTDSAGRTRAAHRFRTRIRHSEGARYLKAVLPPTVVGMRHDNDAVPTVRSKAFTFIRAHLSSPRRAVAYGLLAAVGTGALAMAARPDTADAAPTTVKTA